MGQVKPVDNEVIRRLYVEEGLSLSQVGRQVGLGAATVCQRLRVMGVERRPARLPRGTRTSKLPEEALQATVRLYVNDGLSLRQVSEIQHLSCTAVHRRLKIAGVRLRPQGQHGDSNGRRFPGHAAMDETVRLYRSGLSSIEVAERLGIHQTSVLKRLRRAGVPRRDPGESMRLRWARRPKATA